jgi:hypothetical protein
MDAGKSRATTVAILQPGYLPWLGFFDQLSQADVFVYYDDVQFDKHGWRNRNRIKSTSGQPQWLTVPVRHHGLGQPNILDVQIDPKSSWPRKHLGSIRQAYHRAPFLSRYLGELEEVLLRPWELLVDLDIAVVDLVCRWLGLAAPALRSSKLGIDGGQSERLLRIVQHFGGKRYLSGAAARSYLDTSLFERNGIEVVWQDYRHPVYPQLHGPFVPYLSVLDLILNCGEAGGAILVGRGEKAA